MSRSLAFGWATLGVLLLPCAAAVDLLPTEVRLGDDEARLLVRSAGGGVRVTTDPPTLAAGVTPGGAAESLSLTPTLVNESFAWRGLDGILEIVLRRDDPGQAIDIILEDSGNVGVWVEWPGAGRAIPAPAPIGALAIALILRRAAAREASRRVFPHEDAIS